MSEIKRMSLREAMSMKTATSVTVGEVYEINGLNYRYVEDKINGGDRICLILETNKGNIYAPSAIANAFEATMLEEGEQAANEILIGTTCKGVSYYSKRFKKDCITLEFC